MTIRLDTYPEAQIAMQMLPQNPPSATPTLCCLLHTGPLPPSHQVEVWVEGTQQPAYQEGSQDVFSWTCTKGSEVRIHLKQHDRLVKSWRGWWLGETTIAHTGTLRVQVYCAGALQPAGLPRAKAAPVEATALLSSSTDQHNGTRHDGMAAVATWPAVTTATQLSPSVTEGPSADDDLWEQARQDAHSGVVEEAEAVSPPEQETWEEAARQEAEERDREQIVEEPASPKMQPLPVEQEHPTLHADTSIAAAPVGTILASFPALIVWSQTAHQEQETRLTNLLAAMPAQTILVDLRPHTPTLRRSLRKSTVSGQQKLGLSKELLRNCYGGCYWDCGVTIQTVRRLVSMPPPTWDRVVTNPDDPDGLGTLVTALRQGFSLVVLDGETNYAASARAAVLTELRQRVANVIIGSCS